MQLENMFLIWNNFSSWATQGGIIKIIKFFLVFSTTFETNSDMYHPLMGVEI